MSVLPCVTLIRNYILDSSDVVQVLTSEEKGSIELLDLANGVPIKWVRGSSFLLKVGGIFSGGN